MDEDGELEQAETAFRNGLSLDWSVTDTHLQLGHVLRLQGRRYDAIATYLRAFALDPSRSDALRELAGLGWSEGELFELRREAAPRGHPAATTGPPDDREGQPIVSYVDEFALMAGGSLTVRGWAASEAGVQCIELLLDGSKVGEAQLGFPRPDVLSAYPTIPMAGHSGFAFRKQLGRAFDGDHLLSVVIRGADGAVRSTELLVCAAEELRTLPPTQRQFRVLYVSSMPIDRSHEYRVENYIEALRRNGIEAEWIAEEGCENNVGHLHRASIVVFWRVALRPPVRRFIDAAERLRVPVVYDIDDYVFEPQIATPTYIDGIRFLPEGELEAYRWGVRAYRAMLLSCQFATFTTKFLVDRGNELGRRSFLLPNGLDRIYVNTPAREHSASPTEVVIGYTPGTQTHQQDMRLAARAIARVLAENPGVIFQIVGYFDIDEIEEWGPVRTQIEQDPTIGRDYVRLKTGEFDINIAPVELDNPFTEAKSELKYFEPACLGVPTVASATAVFRDAIRHGETGFLVRSEDDWYSALTAMVRDPSLRQKLGAAARKHVLAVYSPEALGSVARRAYGDIILAYRAGIGRTPQALVITMVMCKLGRGSGGHAKAISLMRGLSRRGHDIAIHFIHASDDFATADEIRNEYDLTDRDVITWGDTVLRPSDVAIATRWDTAYVVHEQSGCGAAKVYLMQDYEPMFFPMSDEYLRAEQSYRLGLRQVSYGPWVRDRVKREIGVDSDWIPFFIDQSIFYPDANVERAADRLIVFARPEMPRRLWNLTVAAIELFQRRAGFTGRVEFFGSKESRDVPFSHMQRGVITPPEMAKLFREGTAGIAISPTNQSMVPFEMMACGLPVIDIDYSDNHVSYGGRENVCLLCPEPACLADGLARLMEDKPARDQFSSNALKFIAEMPDETAVVAQFERLLKSYLASDKPSAYTPSRGPITAPAVSS